MITPETAEGHHPLAPSIVRIRAEDHSVVGAGFLVAENYVATCSHVVADALGLPAERNDAPSGEVHLDFPFLAGAPARATVVAWEPARAEETGDIAVLALTRPAPDGARPVRLVPAQRTAGKDFEVYGFPEAADEGRWSYGVVRDRLPSGWVQAEDRDGQGYRIQPGYSGAPVWVSDTGVIGMVVGAERNEAARVGFLIAIELIVAACPAPAATEKITSAFGGLLDGLNAVPSTASGGFRLFLREYLGLPDEPVPFGGREESLNALDAWFGNPGTPYGLLVAPAGRGKSALLARWCSDVASDGRAAVAFVPLSIRFRTASEAHLVGLLGARLRHLTGRTGEPPTSPQGWLDEIQATLAEDRPDGQRLLVVLDGLDEATGWSFTDALLLPDTPGRGIKLLVSARELADRDAEGWRRLLNWDWQGRAVDIPLKPLDRAGVAVVMRSLGGATGALADRDAVVDQMVRLSEGDPLIVRLYVEALRDSHARGASLTSETLPDLPPGLKGFFKQWWRDQKQQWGDERSLREPQVQTMYMLLAMALGPVLVDDVLAVAPSDKLPDALAIDDAVEVLQRFVVGDGRELGWVFSHPRLGQYFRELLGGTEIDRWTERFVGYGAAVADALLAGRRSPEQAPAYAVQWYASHLRLAQAPLERFDVLATPQWLEAWEALEGAEDGFLGDLRNAQRRANRVLTDARDQPERAAAISRSIRFALVASSVTSLAGNVPPNLLRALVREQQWTPEHALAYARRTPDEHQRGMAVAALAADLPDALLADALGVVRAIGDDEARISAATAIAPNLPAGMLNQALAVVDTVKNDVAKSALFVALTPHLRGGVLAGALEGAGALPPGPAARAQAALAGRFEGPKRDEVLAVAAANARSVPKAEERAYALASVAQLLPPPQDRPMWEEFLAAVEGISSESSRSWAVESQHDKIPDALIGRILVILQGFSDRIDHDSVLGAFAERLSEDEARQVLNGVKSIVDPGERQSGLAALAPVASPAIVRDALDAACAETAFNSARTVGTLAGRLAELGFAEEALTAVLDAPRGFAQPEALQPLAPELPPELLDRAIEALLEFRSREDSVYRAAALAKFTARLAQTGRGEDAVARARLIEIEHYRLAAIAEIAPYVDGDALDDAISIALPPPGMERDSRVLSALSRRLLELDRPERALDLAEAIEDRDYRVRILDDLALRLPAHLLPRAVIATRLLSDQVDLARAMAELLSDVPEKDRGPLYAAALGAADATTSSAGRASLLKQLIANVPAEWADATIRAARGITDPFYRQQALAGLLPNLVKSGATDTALAVAREARAVEDLIELLAPEHRPALIVEAADQARGSNFELDRAQRLARLSALVDGPTADHLRTEAIEIARSSSGWALTTVLEQLPAEHRVPALVEEAVLAARGIDMPETRASTLVSLMPFVSAEEGIVLASEALDAVEGIPNEYDRAHQLARVAPSLPPALLDGALVLAAGLRDHLWLRTAFRDVLPALAAAGRQEEALDRTLAAPTGRIDGRILAAIAAYLTQPLLSRALAASDDLAPYDRGEALSGLGPRLATLGRPIGALQLIVTIPSRESRATALRAVVPALMEAPAGELARAWGPVLQVLAARNRTELLSDVAALAPVIATLGGAEAARATSAAVADVGVWFP